MIFYDTETCGFHGPIVLVQYAEDNNPPTLYNPWNEPINDTLKLIEYFCTHEGGVCAFNNVYDWFHICQFYTTLLLLGEKVGYNEEPVDHINQYAELEPLGRDGPCLKPVTALDLMLFARKGPYQSTMDRKNIRIKHVPQQLAEYLCAELESRVKLRDIYFARSKDQKRWHIVDSKQKKPGFVDVELKFRASSALKTLVKDALGEKDDEVLLFSEIGVASKYNPIEAGWAPFALALSDKSKDWYAEVRRKGQLRKGFAWPGVIQRHIDHWRYDTLARQYGGNDVIYLQKLYKYFGCPPSGDNDSLLTCMAGASRWRGFTINQDYIKVLKAEAEAIVANTPKAPAHVRYYLNQVMNDVEKIFIEETTKKTKLEEISKWTTDDEATPHPAAVRAKHVLDARIKKFELTVFDKLLQAGRFHASSVIIGSLSGRMSGTDGLNALGISHEEKIRRCFTFGNDDLPLCGGDFESFEVSIAEAKYNDKALRSQLLTCYKCKYERTLAQIDEFHCPSCGEPDSLRKIHGLFAMELYPGKSYDEILSTKKSANDLYDAGKRGIFAIFYGGNYFTLMERLNIDEQAARDAEKGFFIRYKGVGLAAESINERFCSMTQPGGLGSKVIWKDPDDYVESMNGYRRYFTLENAICKELFAMGEDPPKEWGKIKLTCVRRDREQKIGNATKSALFAAAFQLQAKNMRAAKNHEIQSTGAILAKELQTRLWAIQPAGIHPWQIQMLNIHDELECPTRKEHWPRVEQIVTDFVKEHRKLIPLLKIEWKTGMKSWAEK